MGDDDVRAVPINLMNADFFVKATNMQNEMRELEMTLRGLKISVEGYMVKDETKVPLINQEGWNVIKTVLGGVLNKNTYMSDIDSDRINELVSTTSMDLQDTLFFNRGTFEIEDRNRGVYELIITIVENFLILALARAVEGRERQAYHTMTSETTHRLYEQQGRERSGGIRGWVAGLLPPPKSKGV